MTKKKAKFNDDLVKQSVVMGAHFLLINLFTSGMILLLLFTASLVTGKELWMTSLFQTIMLPLILWYYGHISYQYGYRQSVRGTSDIRCAWVSVLPLAVFQIAFVLATINELATKPEGGTVQFITEYFVFNPFALLMNSLSFAMPELMLLLPAAPLAAIYIGYKKALGKEIVDHSMGEEAKAFRREVEEQIYGREDAERAASEEPAATGQAEGKE